MENASAAAKALIKAKVKAKLVRKTVAILASFFCSSFGLIFLLVIVICLAVAGQSNAGNNTIYDYSGFTKEVEQYRSTVDSLADSYGLLGFTDAVLAIIRVETGGEGTDPMNAGDKPENTKYPQERGAIEDPNYSIQCGMKALKRIFDTTGVTGYIDTPKLLIAYQAYHFDPGYIAYAQTAGGYSSENAKEYQNKYNLPYYYRPAFATLVQQYVSYITAGIDTYIYPMADYIISSHFNTTGTGTVFTTKADKSQVNYIAAGTITSVSYNNGIYEITVETNTNTEITYHGLNKISDTVLENATVVTGNHLGLIDQKGSSLTITVKKNGEYVDLEKLIEESLENIQDSESNSGIGNDINVPLTGPGSDIVNFAKQFCGKIPYVWGGTSLETGVDCSGFTLRVYEHFGYSLPRTSVSQSNMQGTRVLTGGALTPQNLQLGDLIFYYNPSLGRVGHVAIYAGNGTIVHAASERSGLLISPWNFSVTLQPIKAITII